MRKKTKTISILTTLLVIGILIYQSPDEAYWFKENLKDAIEIGETYAWYLFHGYKQGLLKVSIHPAKIKIENSYFQEITVPEIHEELRKIQLDPESLLEKKQLGKYGIVSPLFVESKSMEPFVP